MNLRGFQGTSRFEIRRMLGTGTAGAVYEVWDHERGGPVALKVLHQTDPASLYRFKQEFRSLAHLNHPNLVPLYELQNEDEYWFVIMELVDGVDFIHYVRHPSAVERGPSALEERLRPAVRQLAQGIAALHAAGCLHRDVKPSNVLVAKDGKLTILDFGLVTKASAHQTYQSYTEGILGTPAYMAPEQGTGADVSEATDWYGVGALIYEALLGEPPFAGQFVQVMLEKQQREPTPPRQRLAEVSEDLDQLCRDLLRRDPAARPGGVDVLERLGSDEAGRHATLGAAAPHLVGRDPHLAVLWDAFERVRDGEEAVVYVHGVSGLGKTALVKRFLHEVREKHDDAVTLSGRCFEHETVPYKAFDSVVDGLTRYLRSLSYRDVAGLLPRDVLVLARLFPVLKRVKAVADARRRVLEIPDSHELRRRAFAALRELLTRLAEDRPLMVTIDDLQWGDFDSAVLLSDLMRLPEPPPLLLIGAYRDEDAATSPLLQALLPGSPSATELAGVDVEVGELAPAAAVELARELLGTEEPYAEAVARIVAHDSHGSPLFVEELVRHVLSLGGDAVRVSAVPSLDEVLRSRVAELAREARELAEILAVAGRPVELEVARRAAELEADDPRVSPPSPQGAMKAFTQLRLGNLARSSGGRGDGVVEMINDRVRRAVLAGLEPPRLIVHHLRLARELEATGRCDPETLAHHFAAAGEPARALEYASEAAERSAKALAFNRAARLFRRALDLEPEGPESARWLRQRLAEVLVNAGRGAEAATVFLRLAEGAPTAEALEMRRRAAHFYLVSGHVDQGLEILDGVLASVGMKLGLSSWRIIPGTLLRRLWLGLRGLSFKQRDATQVSAEELTRIDTCWSAAIGLAIVDKVHGAAFQARQLQLALRAGEPYRVARALALEVSYSASGGGRTRQRTERLVRDTAELVRRSGDPHTFGLATLTAGLAAFLGGRFQDALTQLERAEEILRDRCTGVIWELDNAQFFTLLTLHFLGEGKELMRRLPVRVKEARERGDLYALTSIETRISWLAHLADDDPETARHELAEAIGRWSRRGLHLQHVWTLLGECEIDLYRGEPAAAEARLAERWRPIRRSFFPRLQVLTLELRYLRGRTALAAAAAGREDSRRPANRLPANRRPANRRLASAARDARLMRREKMAWSNPLAGLLEAGIAHLEGRGERAAALLDKAERDLEAADMKLHAAAVRRRRGELAGGDQGQELCERADREMREQRIMNPERFAHLLAPGFQAM